MATPFSISPNPLSLYLTPSLRAVLNKVRFVVNERQGLTTITGDVGMGKSSIVRMLHEEFSQRSDFTCRLIVNPSYNTDFAFVRAICAEFDVPPKRSLYDQEKALREFLIQSYAAGKSVIVLIDEAQKLTGPMLEQVRAMLNYETNDAKLIQLVLSAQPELRDRLRDSSKRAIRSRIYAASTLDPLTFDETVAMVQYRCDLFRVKNPFTEDAMRRVYKETRGVPRDVVKICGIAFSLHTPTGLEFVHPEIMEIAAVELGETL